MALGQVLYWCNESRLRNERGQTYEFEKTWIRKYTTATGGGADVCVVGGIV
jgi:hypothetical protein